MSKLRQSLRQIPFWAYLLVLLVIAVNTIYLIFRYKTPFDGIGCRSNIDSISKNEYLLITSIQPGSPAETAGLRTGDIIKLIDSITISAYYSHHSPMAGNILTFRILRDNKEVSIPIILGSVMTGISSFFQIMYGFFILMSFASVYILYKKPRDSSARIFFIYIQLFAIVSNARYLQFQDPFAAFANTAFIFSGCLYGTALIHFHLLFPKPAAVYTRYKRFPVIFYGLAGIVALLYSVSLIVFVYHPSAENESVAIFLNLCVMVWLTTTFFLALVTVIYQYVTIKNTLARNQLSIVIIGAFFVFITPMILTFFPDIIGRLRDSNPFIAELCQGIGSFIMIICLLIAIFRYRIWDLEIIIRKALLYLGATLVILLSYLFLIYLVDLLTISETNVTRFLILTVSVILFLVLRDRIQRLIDRFFHRETYDSATVVSDFEEKLAGIYRFDELKQKIVQGLDEIFHFISFVFYLKTKKFSYQPVFVFGIDDQRITGEFEGNAELEQKLRKSKIFSPDELNVKPSIFEKINGELIVPLLEGDQMSGFFICGQKKSERIYSRQDINVLALLARRVIALLHTATLYQKDLDRQLILERERARISQDMHDDIGAGLTKIAMISEAPVKMQDAGYKMQDAGNWELGTGNLLFDRLQRIATSSREMISRLNVIVWALNPKYDNLESLISYLRRYFGEYLENFGILFKTDLPEQIPELSITPDTRRNIFYAVQEAIHNAVKHSDCSEISLVVKIREQNMELTISDNGKGFDQVKPGSGGNGLLNMKKRAEEMGGRFEIQSSLGSGTTVFFNIKTSH